MRRGFGAVLACTALTSLLVGGSAYATGGTLNGERIDIQLENTTYITPSSVTCNPTGVSTVNFTVSGPVTGPYPGTLTGSGSFMIGPQTEAGYFNNNGRNVGPITSFTETYTIQSGSTTITGSGSLIDPPPGASIGGARLNTAECAELTGATLGSVTNASGTV